MLYALSIKIISRSRKSRRAMSRIDQRKADFRRIILHLSSSLSKLTRSLLTTVNTTTDQLSSGAMVPAKRQISWGCVATSNDDLTALNGKSRSNSSLPQIVNQAQYVSRGKKSKRVEKEAKTRKMKMPEITF